MLKQYTVSLPGPALMSPAGGGMETKPSLHSYCCWASPGQVWAQWLEQVMQGRAAPVATVMAQVDVILRVQWGGCSTGKEVVYSPSHHTLPSSVESLVPSGVPGGWMVVCRGNPRW